MGEKKKRKMKLFGKGKSKRKEDSDDSEGDSASGGYPNYPHYQQSLPPPDNDNRPKKKKKFGKIKRLFKGKSKATGSEREDGPAFHQDYNPHDPPQQFIPPPPRPNGLDPKILAQIEASDSEGDSSSSDESDFRQELKPVAEEEEEDEESDDDLSDTVGRNFVHRASKSRKKNKLGPDSDDDDIQHFGESGVDFISEDMGSTLDQPVTLVILLLDPDTLRFELLQLDLENPKGLKVQSVLEQLSDSITEPALQPLKFGALMDRAGVVSKADVLLTKAMLHRRDKYKDILVGVYKGAKIDDLYKRARPILGDVNVGRMVSACLRSFALLSNFVLTFILIPWLFFACFL